MTELKALLFDVDGTLADTERDGHRVAFNRAFAAAGLDWHWDVETYGQLLKVAGGKERLRHFIDTCKPAMAEQAKLDHYITTLHAAKTRHFITLLQAGAMPLRPGVARLLKAARAAGLRLAIATTSTARNVEALLAMTLGEQSVGWFDVIAAGDVVAAKKPAPDIYIYALQQLGLSARECLAFEDSDVGFLAAGGAGLKTIVTVNAYTRRQHFADNAIVLDQLGEPDAGFSLLSAPAWLGSTDASYVDITLLKRWFTAWPDITPAVHPGGNPQHCG